MTVEQRQPYVPPRDYGRVLLGGFVAGLVGGVLLAALLVVLNALAGYDVWLALKGAGTPFLGGRSAMPGWDPAAVLVGFGCHLLVSVVWAVPFAIIVDGLPRGATVIAGIFWGILVWVGMFYVVLPLVGMGQVARSAPAARAIVEHIGFGVVVALAYLPFQRTGLGRAPRIVRTA